MKNKSEQKSIASSRDSIHCRMRHEKNFFQILYRRTLKSSIQKSPRAEDLPYGSYYVRDKCIDDFGEAPLLAS
jgi:hypothetical protein